MQDEHARQIAELLAKKDYKGAQALEEAIARKQDQRSWCSEDEGNPQDMRDSHDKQIAELILKKDYQGAQELEEKFAQEQELRQQSRKRRQAEQGAL